MESDLILNGNKLIAEFMGETKTDYGKPAKYLREDLIFYHSSWDWLMPVCKKLGYLAENKVIPFSKDYEYWCDQLEDSITRTYDIEPAFKRVVDFIQWYNTQTK